MPWYVNILYIGCMFATVFCWAKAVSIQVPSRSETTQQERDRDA
jgi:hypothetical protein